MILLNLGSPNIDPAYEVINGTSDRNGTFYVPDDWNINEDESDNKIAGVSPIVFGIITALLLFGFIIFIVTLSLIRWGIDRWRYRQVYHLYELILLSSSH